MTSNGFQTRKQCLNCLDQLQIKYILHQHQPVFTMNQLSKIKLDNSPFIKNLFYTDKKQNSYYMVVAENNTKIQKGFWKCIGINHNNVRMAKQQQVLSVLKCKKGAINLFSLANDSKKEVKKLLIDQKLDNFQNWSFHPMDNSATIQLNKKDIIKFLDHFQISYQSINLSQQFKKQQKQTQNQQISNKQIQNKQIKQKQTKQKQPKTSQTTKTKKIQPQQKKKAYNINLIGIQSKKQQDFSNWYSEVIIRSGMLDYYDIGGCYILRPWAFGIWERIQAFFDALIKQHGVQNAYFPMFVSKKSLQTQKQHVAGFAPQVAWVTKSGHDDLAQPIAIRPTSETIMYPAYSNWIKSHRDLPLRLNQWTNIVRWQFKHPTPFIRTRQFLWQEGHTAHATFQQAQQQTFCILQYYRRVYEQLLAIPVYKGVKTESQKFAGGFKTTTIQTWIAQNGRAIQAATSHNLGQNFAKMFQILFEDKSKNKSYVWQTSWGLTTRSLGILTMHHGDNKGLVLPPKVANIQVVIIPIIKKGKQEIVLKTSQELFGKLKKQGIRIHFDDRDIYTPGWKYNHWELKGVPIRIQIGPNDVEKQSVTCVFRYNEQKIQVSLNEIQKKIPQFLVNIQQGMFERAKKKLLDKVKQADTWQQFMIKLNQNNIILTPWCQNLQCQEQVKKKSGIQSKQMAHQSEIQLTGQAKTLCKPLDAPPVTEDAKCFHCGKKALVHVLWGRSY